MKALSFVAGPAAGPIDPSYDYTTFPEVVRSADDAYAQAGITNPRAELAMAEVHDCFTPTELVLMEDLGFAERGMAWKEVLAGTFDLDGELPVNPDGGLKSFGHPIGASGLRMLFEAWLQLRGEAPEARQIESVGDGQVQGPHPQPRRRARRVRELRLDRRHRAGVGEPSAEGSASDEAQRGSAERSDGHAEPSAHAEGSASDEAQRGSAERSDGHAEPSAHRRGKRQRRGAARLGRAQRRPCRAISTGHTKYVLAP